MDNALRQRMEKFPTQAQIAGLITPDDNGQSTLVKADISLFHAAPDTVAMPRSNSTSELSDYDAGLREGEAKAAAIYQETIHVMEAALGALKSELSNIVGQIEQSHLAALSSCLKTISPSLTSLGADLEIQGILRELSATSLQGKIEVKTHAENISHVERLCTAWLEDMIITADKSLIGNAVKINWQGGGAVIDCEAASQACLSVLDEAQLSFNKTNPSGNIQMREQPDE